MRRSNLQIIFGVLFFLVGAAIIFLIVNDDDDGDTGPSLANGQRQVTVIVAATDIEAGTFGNELPAEALTTETVAATQAPANAITSANDLANSQFATAVSSGDVITSSQLRQVNVGNTPVPEGLEGLALQLDFVDGGAQYVGAGDRVNVFVHYELCELTQAQIDQGITCPPFDTPSTELIVTNVQVLAVNRQVAAASASATTTPSNTNTVDRATDTSPVVYLLAVTTEDAERLIFGGRTGTLVATLQADGNGPAGNTDGKGYDDVKAASQESSTSE